MADAWTSPSTTGSATNRPSWSGLEDMPRVVDTLVKARPDAIQMAYGAG